MMMIDFPPNGRGIRRLKFFSLQFVSKINCCKVGLESIIYTPPSTILIDQNAPPLKFNLQRFQVYIIKPGSLDFKDRANGRDAQTAADIISEINNEQEDPVDNMQGTGDGLEDIRVDVPLTSPTAAPVIDTPIIEESSAQKNKRRKTTWGKMDQAAAHQKEFAK